MQKLNKRSQNKEQENGRSNADLLLELEPKNSEARRQLYLARQLQESGGVGKGAAPSRAVRVQNVAHDQDNDDDTSGVWIGLTRRF